MGVLKISILPLNLISKWKIVSHEYRTFKEHFSDKKQFGHRLFDVRKFASLFCISTVKQNIAMNC